MKSIIVAFVLVVLTTVAYSQTNAGSTPGSITGDPAASSANSKTDTTGMSPSKSGSGTSTSGGKDANGDQGRDTMPDSNKSVLPLDKQNKPRT